jgi:hypothetical protein
MKNGGENPLTLHTPHEDCTNATLTNDSASEITMSIGTITDTAFAGQSKLHCAQT